MSLVDYVILRGAIATFVMSGYVLGVLVSGRFDR